MLVMLLDNASEWRIMGPISSYSLAIWPQ